MLRLPPRIALFHYTTLFRSLVVIVIIGILLAIAVPSYLGFKDRANRSAAAADVRAAVPSAEAYFSDCNTDGPLGGLTATTALQVPATTSVTTVAAGTVADPL